MRRNEAGFTMIEVMVAMLLTAIAIIGILALFMTQRKASGYSRHTTEATVLAQDKLEQLRTLTGAAQTGSDTLVDEKGSNAGTGIYTRTWQETLVGTAYAEIKATVTWEEDGDTKSVVLFGRRKQ
jgi:type IV pilus modification protein PilV